MAPTPPSRPPTAPPPRPRAVTVGCPAKLNLHLRVGPPRADGFHPLLTWMVTAGLFDTLRLRVREAAAAGAAGPTGEPASDVVRLTCDPPTLPADERNLVVRAVRAWGEAAREGLAERVTTGTAPRLPPIDAALAKRTPAGAGLGGGSSDAAFALLAADRLWTGRRWPAGEPRAVDELSAFAARLGSDVPFFLHGPSGVCAGRGEVVRPVARPAARWAVLVLPAIVMPTPDVYRRFDAMGLGRAEAVGAEPDWAAWARLPATDLMARLVNDLEPPAFAIRPELADLRRQAESAAGRAVRMSGSGSSLFTLFDGAEEAKAAADEVGRIGGRAGQLRAEVVDVCPAVRWEEES